MIALSVVISWFFLQAAAANEADPFSGNDDEDEDAMLSRALEASMAQFDREQKRKSTEDLRSDLFQSLSKFYPWSSWA